MKITSLKIDEETEIKNINKKNVVVRLIHHHSFIVSLSPNKIKKKKK
jgi:hypothetical protein